MKIAFVFSGQGSQYPGMGKELYDKFPECRSIYEIADESLNRSITDLCFYGRKEEIDITANTQPCMLATELAIFEALKVNDILPDVVSGFSLGEYAAFSCAKSISVSDVFKLISVRANAMQEAVPVGMGAMVAVIGASSNTIEELCGKVDDEYVAVSNYNSPKQIVVAGTRKGIEHFSLLAEKEGYSVIPLSVSVPSHCSLMLPAAEKVKEYIEDINFDRPVFPIYANYDADAHVSEDDIKELLYNQLVNPVRWFQSIEKMVEDGVDTFIECGPGKTLSGLIRKTVKGVNIYRVENIDSLQNTVQAIKG